MLFADTLCHYNYYNTMQIVSIHFIYLTQWSANKLTSYHDLYRYLFYGVINYSFMSMIIQIVWIVISILKIQKEIYLTSDGPRYIHYFN